MLCAVPLLRGLRQRYPDAYISLMTSPVNHEVMVHNPYVDRVINYDKRAFVGRASLKWRMIVKFVGELRREKFELVIVPSTVSASATSDMFSYLSGARYRVGASKIDGIENSSSIFFSCPVMLDWRKAPHRHQTLRHIDIVEALIVRVDDLSSRIQLTDGELAGAHSVLTSLGIAGAFVVCHPGAGKLPNRWPAERFADVAISLSREFNTTVVITHGPMDDEPVALMASKLSVPYAVVEKKTIREVAAILSLARLVISNDTGIMHVAAAVGTPVLSLFGPTDPEQWAPMGGKHRYIQAKGGRIEEVSVDEVLSTAREMLR